MTKARLLRHRHDLPVHGNFLVGFLCVVLTCVALSHVSSSLQTANFLDLYLRGTHPCVLWAKFLAWEKRQGLKEEHFQHGRLVRISKFAVGPHGLEKVPTRTISFRESL